MVSGSCRDSGGQGGARGLGRGVVRRGKGGQKKRGGRASLQTGPFNPLQTDVARKCTHRRVAVCRTKFLVLSSQNTSHPGVASPRG